MNPDLIAAVENAIPQATNGGRGGASEGEPTGGELSGVSISGGESSGDRSSGGRGVKVAQYRSVGGGCISNAHIIQLEDARKFFLKSNTLQLKPMFDAELLALDELAKSQTIKVPRPLVVGQTATQSFILMQPVNEGPRPSDFFQTFGQQFAQLHHATRQPSSDSPFGFHHDNFIGATHQPNTWTQTWVEFFAQHRLAFQLNLAGKNNLATPQLTSLGQSLIDKLPDLIASPNEPACLLHGDLWSGNYMNDEEGQPVIIDPASYYGSREADLAMTHLFGGFPQTFYDAYNHHYPLQSGYRDRIEIYKLYHLLNHLNLFGSSYLSQCLSILKHYA